MHTGLNRRTLRLSRESYGNAEGLNAANGFSPVETQRSAG